MSRSDLPLILSSKVQDDFADILQYSLETWGEAQAFAYRAVLHQAVPTIPENPQIGHGRPELSPAHRIFLAGRHSIVYRITDLAILVSRIPRAHGTRPPRVTQA